VRLEENSGWDAASVADIIQDAVDKGQWQDIDGQGGTISHPLNDVLLIQNNVSALCQVLAVLNRLKHRPVNNALPLNSHRSAGMGRKAPENDWYFLSEPERTAIRLQADRLPEVDEVVCYIPKLPTENNAFETLAQFKENLHPLGVLGSVRLRGKDAVEIADLWRNMSFHAHQPLLTDVYLPWVDLVFKRNGKVVSKTCISWSMNTVLFKYPNGKYQRYDYNPRTGPARRLRDRLIAHQAMQPILLKDWLERSSKSN
jgi:hypothetical protein